LPRAAWPRLRTLRRCCSRAPESSPAPLPAARSTTGGSIQPKRCGSYGRRERARERMFKVRVIPCLDVKDGRVVKGVKFLDLRDAGDPVAAAIAYDAARSEEHTSELQSPCNLVC